jgi:hypothetical protein
LMVAIETDIELANSAKEIFIGLCSFRCLFFFCVLFSCTG